MFQSRRNPNPGIVKMGLVFLACWCTATYVPAAETANDIVEPPSVLRGTGIDIDSDGDGLTDEFEKTHYVCIQGWGNNQNKQAMNNLGLAHIASLSAGFRHNLVLSPDGVAFAWGQRNDVPPGLGRVRAVAAGSFFSAALKLDGTVVVWGLHAEEYEELRPPPGLNNVSAISAGGQHVLAIDGEGRVHAWGLNEYGQTNVPPGLSNVVAVAAGGEFSLALDDRGKITAWGNNYLGALNVPEDLHGVRSITAGRYFAAALLDDGSVRVWGRNPDGKWFDDIQPPPEVKDVIQLVAGSYHCVALRRDGQVFAWGKKTGTECDVPENLANVVRIAAGGMHTLAVTALLDPGDPDSDGDGLLDGDEVNNHHTSPWLQDTDGDGWGDGFEIAHYTNPLERPSTGEDFAHANFPVPGSLGEASTGRLIKTLCYRYENGRMVLSLFGEEGYRYRVYGMPSLMVPVGAADRMVADFLGSGAEVDVPVTPWCDTCFFFFSVEKEE